MNARLPWPDQTLTSVCIALTALGIAGSQRSLAAPVLWSPNASTSLAQGTGVTHAGRAAILNATDIQWPDAAPAVLCDSGPLPGTGGLLEASAETVNIANGALVFEAAHAFTSGEGRDTLSEARMSNFLLLVSTSAGQALLRADYVSATVTASLRHNGRVNLSSHGLIEGLMLNNQAIAVTGHPNQVVQFAGGQLILNAQSSTVNGDITEITLTPLRVTVQGGMNAVFCQASAGIHLPPSTALPAAAGCGKLTGGGWIVGTPSGEKGTLAVGGGIRRGQPWGHLNYIDHNTGMHVHATATTGFEEDPVDPDCRIIEYDVTINGAPGTATVRACDKGEPGRNDTFEITVSNNYHASGSLGGDGSGGGNIQLHRCPPGWESR